VSAQVELIEINDANNPYTPAPMYTQIRAYGVSNFNELDYLQRIGETRANVGAYIV